MHASAIYIFCIIHVCTIQYTYMYSYIRYLYVSCHLDMYTCQDTHTHTHTHTLVQRPLGVTGALKHPGRLPIAPADGNTDAASCSHYMSLAAAFSITCTTQYCSTRLITTFGFFTTFSTHYCSRRSPAAEGRTVVAG